MRAIVQFFKTNLIAHLILIGVSVFFIMNFILIGCIIPTPSMSPTIPVNSYVMGLRYSGSLHRGDIIIYRSEDILYLKRIIGLQGEQIKAQDGVVYVNGVPITEDYAVGITSNFEEVTINDDAVYVMGDNRENSIDSRSFGELKTASIIGKELFTIGKKG